MSKNLIEHRKQKYAQLSSQIAQLDNSQLSELLNQSDSQASSTGWGRNQMILLGQSKVFVKHVPVTHLESENLFSTGNLYNLPTTYCYGFGSPGFGVFRELVTHIKTTDWVLAGEIANFPLMYHYRIMPCSGQCAPVDGEQWSHDENARRYVLDKAIANYELVLFLEYIPHVLESLLHNNPQQLENALRDIRTTLDFLQRKNIIHFDAHFRNILTDGQQTYLTDFGLALDQSFTLTEAEVTFFEENKFYDYGEVLRNLGHLIRAPYRACPGDEQRRIRHKYGIREGAKLHEVGTILLNHIEQIHLDKDLDLDDFYVASIIQYRDVIELMQSFFVEMCSNEKKDTKLPYIKLECLLKETGLLAD
jgi:serine/threonine protein kinase